MSKRAAVVILIVLMGGLLLKVGLSKIEAKEMAEDVTISAAELQGEMNSKNIRVGAAEAVKIAEERVKGKAVGLRLRRMKFDVMGYNVTVLADKPAALKLVVIDATTAEVVAEGAVDKYLIIPGAKHRVNVEAEASGESKQ